MNTISAPPRYHDGRESHPHTTVVLALTLLYLTLLVRTAWLCDDAYITLRTVDNALQGFGLRWNVSDRVQTYTHPLWLLILCTAGGITRELYVTTIVLSIAASTAAVALLLGRCSRSTTAVLAAGLLLVLAPGFLSYSTSGLENPLSFLLAVFFVLVLFRAPPTPRRSLVLGFVAGLALANRPDHVWLYAPALVYDLLRNRSRRSSGAMAVGFVPLFAWYVFALVYYGFVVPNTAYAKLATGFGRAQYVHEGLAYLGDASAHETLMSVTLLAAIALGLVLGTGARRAVALGIAAHIVYVVAVGGDFMRGRMLTVPFLLAVGLLLDADFYIPGRVRALVLAPVLALGLPMVPATLLSGPGYGSQLDESLYHDSGPADERAWYFQRHGLLNGKPLADKWGHDMEALRERQARETVRLKIIATAGVGGLASGPNPYVIDHWALGDPLLARLPVTEPWGRIGHFHRAIPAGYLLTRVGGDNRIVDTRIRDYYEDLRVVTQDPLFSRKRWFAIARMNLGRDGHLVAGNKRYQPVGLHEYVDLVDAHLDAVGPKILWEAGRYHARKKELEQATAIIDRLGQLDIAYSDGYIDEALNIGLTYGHRGDVAAGEAILRAVYAAEPGNAGAAYALSKLLIDSDRVAEGTVYLQQAASQNHPLAQRDLTRIEQMQSE